MLHHPIILVPKLVVLTIICVVLYFLRGTLEPEQFQVAVIIGGSVFVGFTVILWVFVARMLRDPNSRLGKVAVLSQDAKSSDGFTAAPDRFSALIGRRGIAVSNLNPAGNIKVDNNLIPVLTAGEFVEADSEVEIVAARGAKVIVKSVKLLESETRGE